MTFLSNTQTNTLMKLLTLILLSSALHAQVYYGAGIGTHPVKGHMDYLLFSNIGYFHESLITEVNLHYTESGVLAPSLLAGIRLPAGERSGIHLIAGATNALEYGIKPVMLKSGRTYYPSGLARYWWRNYDVQAQYFDKQWMVSVGVIGF